MRENRQRVLLISTLVAGIPNRGGKTGMLVNSQCVDYILLCLVAREKDSFVIHDLHLLYSLSLSLADLLGWAIPFVIYLWYWAKITLRGMGKSAFHDSLKALEADILYANALLLGYPRDKDGACFQMRLSYGPGYTLFLFLVQWADYHLAGALGLLRVLIYMTYGDGKTTMSIYERKASIKEFNSVIFPALLQLEKGITDLEEKKQNEVYAIRYKKKEKQSKFDMEREEECGICLEVKAKVVLPNCCHCMCLKCFRDWCERSESCPFCRGNLKRVNSGDLWNYIDDGDVVDIRTIFKENLKRLHLYIEKLPIVDPDPMHVSYEPCRS